jgi:hypothetical protein
MDSFGLISVSQSRSSGFYFSAFSDFHLSKTFGLCPNPYRRIGAFHIVVD